MRLLNFKNTNLVGLVSGGYTWLSQISMLWATSKATAASENQPTRARADNGYTGKHFTFNDTKQHASG